MNAPNNCPICGDKDNWKLIDATKKGFNAKNAVIGGIILGGVGLAAGFSGKIKALYQCTKCGFSHEYDGVADKDVPKDPLSGYKNKGLSAVYIDTIKRVTPDCVFCGKPQDLYIKQDGGGYRFICGHCNAEFRCEFTFSGKVKSKSTQILNSGNVNTDNLQVGICDAQVLIKNISEIK